MLFLGAGAHSLGPDGWPVNLSDLLVSPIQTVGLQMLNGMPAFFFFYMGASD